MNKKNYTKVRGAYALILFLFVSHIFVGWRAAPPQGRTGAPGEGKCTDCHGGNNSQGLDGSMQITGLPAEVMPNTTYKVSVEVANPNGLSSYAGMQMVALTSANENAGSFDNASIGARVTASSSTGRNYLDHSPALIYDANRVATFSVDWTSPADPDPTVTFYAVGNIADGNGGTSNDLILFETQATEVAGVVVTDLPDLTASDVVGFGGTYEPDDVPLFSWNLNNIGTAVAVNEYRIGMYLSADTEFSTDDAFVGEVPTGNTFPGTIVGVPGAIRVPLNYPDGDYYMHLVVDVDNTVEESNEDNNIFTTSSTITVGASVVEPLVLDFVTNVNCDGTGTILVDPSDGIAPYTYEWSTGETTALINVTASGVYNVTVMDAQNTSLIESVEIALSNILVGDVMINQMPGCGALGSAEILADGGAAPYTYQWPDGTTQSTNSALDAGDFVVLITDANGCTLELDLILISSSELDVNSIVQQMSCPDVMDASIALDVTGGTDDYTYLWSNGATTSTITGLSFGNYMVTIDDVQGCTTTASFIITAINPLELIHEIQNESCGAMDGSVSVLTTGGNGPYAYLWSNGAQTNSIANLAMGTYVVTVTDINNCESEGAYFVDGADEIEILSSIINVSCAGSTDGALAVTEVIGGVGPYTYSWSNGEDTDLNTNLEAGIYTVTVTDTNSNCTTEVSLTVLEPAILQIDVDVQSVSCFDGSDGSITIIGMQGGTPPYVFSWPDGTLSPSINGISAGTYILNVTDANDCILVTAITVTQPEELVAAANVQLESNGGRIDLATVGGVSPYTYLWSNGSTAQNITGLTDGVYSVEVTDANGCTYNDSYQIVSTSTKTISELSSWEIYPTPAVDFIMIEATFDKAVPLTMRILSLDGRYLETLVQDFDFTASSQKNRIDVSHLDQGIYLILLESDEGRAVKRFVKM